MYLWDEVSLGDPPPPPSSRTPTSTSILRLVLGGLRTAQTVSSASDHTPLPRQLQPHWPRPASEPWKRTSLNGNVSSSTGDGEVRLSSPRTPGLKSFEPHPQLSTDHMLLELVGRGDGSPHRIKPSPVEKLAPTAQRGGTEPLTPQSLFSLGDPPVSFDGSI